MKSFHIDCELEYDVTQRTLFVFNLGVPTTSGQVVRAESVTSFFGAARTRRLSPLIDFAAPGTSLVNLQTPGSGILLAA
jgi:hypothetical protein